MFQCFYLRECILRARVSDPDQDILVRSEFWWRKKSNSFFRYVGHRFGNKILKEKVVIFIKDTNRKDTNPSVISEGLVRIRVVLVGLIRIRNSSTLLKLALFRCRERNCTLSLSLISLNIWCIQSIYAQSQGCGSGYFDLILQNVGSGSRFSCSSD